MKEVIILDNIIENIKYEIGTYKKGIAFVVDTSNFENQKLIDFISKLSVEMKQLDDSADCHVLLVDCEIQDVCTFKTIDINKIKTMRGGTDIEVAIKYAIDKKWDIKNMYILTDGYTMYSINKNEIPFDVTWLITTDVGTAYGEIIRI